MAKAYFLHQIKHTNGNWDKGIVVKDSKSTSEENFADAKQGYHAYLGAYAYGHDPNTDFVSCMISDTDCIIYMPETWSAPESSADA